MRILFNQSIFRAVLFSVLPVLVVCQVALAQEDSGNAQKKGTSDPKTPHITLGSSSGMPGAPLMIPIYFTPGEGVEVESFKLEINFVSANLKFEKLERAIAAEQGKVELTSDLTIGKNDKGVETSTLHIKVSLSSPDSSKKGIPQGLMGYLTLRISEAGRPAVISLRSSVEGTALGSDRPMAGMQVSDAQVEVIASGTEPAVACFFFSH